MVDTTRTIDWPTAFDDPAIEADTTCPWCNSDGEGDGCDHCSNGFIEPMMNYAYPLPSYVSASDDDNRKMAAENGLFLFSWNDEPWMSLTGGGMDLTPNIIKTYLDLCDYVPEEWALEFDPNYKLHNDETHERLARACLASLDAAVEGLMTKIKSLRFYIEKREDYDRAKHAQDAKFDEDLAKVRGFDDPMLKGLVGMKAVADATKPILPPESETT